MFHKTSPKLRVACIGASVAGLGTALELLKLNPEAQVTLYDRKGYVGANTVCGGAISSFMLRELRMELPSHVIASEINTVRFYAPNGEFWNLESDGEPYGYVLWREKFEMDLARKVLDMGGIVKLNEEVKSLRLNADIVVGADGLLGATRKHIGLPIRDDDVHLAVQRIAHVSSHPNDRIDLYFGREVARQGYAWIIPQGNGQVRIGLGVPLSMRANPNKLLEEFMGEVGATPISKARGKLIPTMKPPRKLVYGNVILVGDAAHLCDPVTGGGIPNALLSGKYAAKAISKGRVEKYDSYCGGLKRRNLMRYRLKRILYEFSDQEFNEMIRVMKDFRPALRTISLAMAHALFVLALRKPKLFTKHKVLKRLIGLKLN